MGTVVIPVPATAGALVTRVSSSQLLASGVATIIGGQPTKGLFIESVSITLLGLDAAVVSGALGGCTLVTAADDTLAVFKDLASMNVGNTMGQTISVDCGVEADLGWGIFASEAFVGGALYQRVYTVRYRFLG